MRVTEKNQQPYQSQFSLWLGFCSNSQKSRLCPGNLSIKMAETVAGSLKDNDDVTYSSLSSLACHVVLVNILVLITFRLIPCPDLCSPVMCFLVWFGPIVIRLIYASTNGLRMPPRKGVLLEQPYLCCAISELQMRETVEKRLQPGGSETARCSHAHALHHGTDLRGNAA